MSDSTIAAPLTMICGPTCGCGKGTPFIPDGHGTWLCPAACMHCGKSFGGSQWATGNPATVVTLTPFLFPDKAQLEIAELRSHVSTLTQARDEAIAADREAMKAFDDVSRKLEATEADLSSARSALASKQEVIELQTRELDHDLKVIGELRSALQEAEKRIKCQTVLLDLITEPDRSPSTATTRDGCWVDDEFNEDCWMCRGDGYRDMTAAEVRAECEKIADANSRAARVIRQWLGWKGRPTFGSKDQSAIDSLLAQLDERSVSRV